MSSKLYEQIAERTNGDVYIGVVGPVRVGKSTFVKRVMELVVIPNIQEEAERLRAQDELPQSSPGNVIMTAEPKFVPAHGTNIQLGEDQLRLQIRLVDCVGYMIDGIKTHSGEEGQKLVHTPWHSEAIPFEEAARIGTDKVIRDHSTIGIVVTTDGSVNNIPRMAVESAEQQIITQLKEIGKPFVIVLNSKNPGHLETIQLSEELQRQHEVPVIATAVDRMTAEEIQYILQQALYEFPITDIELVKPDWTDVLEPDHFVNNAITSSLHEWLQLVSKMKDVKELASRFKQVPFIQSAEVVEANPGRGSACIQIGLKPEVFQEVCDEWLDEPIESKKDWLLFVKEASTAKKAYNKFSEALEAAKKHGYGVSLPTLQDFQPTAPEIIKQNNFYGVSLKAKAASLHIIRVDMEAEFAPLIGSEFHSQQLLKDLKHGYLHDRDALWQTQVFGTSLVEVLKESLRYKTESVSDVAKKRMRETIERMVNEGDRGMVTFIL